MKRRSPLAIGVIAAAAAFLAVDVIGPHAAPRLADADADARSGQAEQAGQAIAGSPMAAALDTHGSVTRPDDGLASSYIQSRAMDDLTALQTFRPGYSFWQNIFTIPDGSIAFGSAIDGRLLAVFPAKGDWLRDGMWPDRTLAVVLEGQRLPRALDERRDVVAQLLERVAGPVLHNPTRGRFLQPNVKPYGPFLQEWAAIYDRFGVPSEVGLAQAIIESGLNGTRRSEAAAIGFCQWLKGNWKQLDRLAPAVIEAPNQTTQAAYCAAYLTVLGTKYGSFIPALSEHHTGGTNVGRTLVNGERLGGVGTREQYFRGAQFAHDLRAIAPDRYRDIYRTYGPRSYLYAEMVFGNTFNVRNLIASTPQAEIYAMRTTRAIPLAEITQRTGLPAGEVRRFNPAMVKRVPAGATLYLPVYVKAFGRDVSFWHRPASAAFATVLNDLVRLDQTPQQWDRPSFEPTLRDFVRRFNATNTEEGSVMATVLAYVLDEAATSGRREILAEFRTSGDIRDLFDRAVRERDAALGIARAPQ